MCRKHVCAMLCSRRGGQNSGQGLSENLVNYLKKPLCVSSVPPTGAHSSLLHLVLWKYHDKSERVRFLHGAPVLVLSIKNTVDALPHVCVKGQSLQVKSWLVPK